MLIYKCATSGEEVLSDAFKIKNSDDGAFIIVEGKYVQRKSGGGLSADLFGGNPSQEDEGGDDCDESEKITSGVDVVLDFDLIDRELTKDLLKMYIKAWLKRRMKAEDLVDDADKIAAFKQKFMKVMPAFVKLMGKEDCSVLTAGGDSFDIEEGKHCPIIGIYRENGMDMDLYFLRDALIEEKQ